MNVGGLESASRSGRLQTAVGKRWAVWKAPLLGLRSTVELDRFAPLFEENFALLQGAAVWKAPLLGLRSAVELERFAPLFEENFTHFDKERRFTNRRRETVGGLESAPPWLTLDGETRSPRPTFRGKLYPLRRARRRHLRLAEREI